MEFLISSRGVKREVCWFIHVLFSTLTIFIFHAEPASSSSGHLNNITDHVALLAIKSQLLDPQNVLSSWNESTHFCEWTGVKCSKRRHPQRVNALDLSSYQLSGSLSPNIANLSLLASLNLSFNNFGGRIPDELGSLRRLKYLDLGPNLFSGQFPGNLTHCSRLRHLDLAKNMIHGRIPTELGSLPNLRRLRLFKNNLSGSIPPSLANLSSLITLDLYQNNLEGSIDHIKALGRLVNLEVLDLGSNQLEGTMPSFVYNMSSLSVLGLSALALRGSLSPELGLLFPNLTQLNLAENLLTGRMPFSLANATKLEVLELGTNNFIGHVSVNFGKLQSLYWFSLEANNLNGGLNFVTSLTNCSNLQTLTFGQNEFSDVLPKSVANLSSTLQALIVQGNQIYGTIPSGIGRLSNLRYLILSMNLFSGTIDVPFGDLGNLEYLFLTGNKLLGPIPDSLGNLTGLSRLYLHDNYLEGTIPSNIGKCQNLQYLRLSNNKLNGTVSAEIFNISSLIEVNLSMNSLAGHFVLYTSKFSQFVSIDVSRNKFSGEIPAALGNCMSLEELIMNGNFFQGSIPLSFRALKGLKRLDLSENELLGVIPEFLEKLGDLKYLNLSLNNFEGKVPNKGIFENLSAFSVFGNDKLCEEIPKLQLPACPSNTHNRKTHVSLTVIVPVIVMVAFFLSISICYLVHRRRQNKFNKSFILSMKQPFPEFTYEQLFKATDGFSSSNLIGVGSFGSVYKGGVAGTSTTIAIKVLNLRRERASKSFITECTALKNIKHRNIVKVLTVCSSIDFAGNDFKALVFEYIPNGNLDEWLHPNVKDKGQSRNLTLIQRISIAIDVASALDYLHNHCHEPIIHCDLKSSNILLDDDMVAHVSDFGLARVLQEDVAKFSQPHSSSLLKGSIGYIAPEYGMSGEATTNGDVYSYGILLLEILSGKRPTDQMFNDSFNLREFAKKALSEQAIDFLDPQLILQVSEMINCDESNTQLKEGFPECLVSLLKLGISCCKESPKERMSIRDVVKNLHSIRDLYHGGCYS